MSGLKDGWSDLSDAQLLDTRLCDLRLNLRQLPIYRHIQALYGELARRGIRFRPHVWLAEEWFSPDGVPGFAVPFYLAHPRLLRLERRMTHEAEGSNSNWLMRILRHEAGHAIDSAYRLRRRAQWRELFGPASRRYPRRYRARPASRQYVQYLGEWYAQAHPTEDFAETFAVWLQPHSDWRRRYADWPAYRKLEYVAELAAQIGATRPLVRSRDQIEPLADNQRTLAQHYRAKLARRGTLRRALADRLLGRLFATGKSSGRAATAASFVRAHKSALRDYLLRQGGADRYLVQQILRLAIERCERRQLYVRGTQRAALPKLRRLLTRLVRSYALSNGLHWHL